MGRRKAEGGDFKCDECENSFHGSGSLREHQKRKHKCSVKISCRDFHQRKDIKLSPGMVAQDKSFDSEWTPCEKEFDNMQDMKTHVWEKHLQGSWICSKCNEILETKGRLNCHKVKKHSNNIKYSCNICQKDFKHPSNLSRHKKEKHKEDLAKPDAYTELFEELIATPAKENEEKVAAEVMADNDKTNQENGEAEVIEERNEVCEDTSTFVFDNQEKLVGEGEDVNSVDPADVPPWTTEEAQDNINNIQNNPDCNKPMWSLNEVQRLLGRTLEEDLQKRNERKRRLELEEENVELVRKIAKLERREQTLNEQKQEEYKKKIKEAENEKKKILDELDQQKNENQQIEKREKEKQQELKLKIAKLEKKGKKTINVNQQIEETANQVKTFKQKIAVFENTQKQERLHQMQVKSELKKTNKKLQTSRKEIVTLKTENESLKLKNQEAENKLLQMATSVDNLKTNKQLLQQAMDETIEEKQTKINELVEEVAEAEIEREMEKSKFEEMKAVAQSKEEDKQQLKTAIAALSLQLEETRIELENEKKKNLEIIAGENEQNKEKMRMEFQRTYKCTICMCTILKESPALTACEKGHIVHMHCQRTLNVSTFQATSDKSKGSKKGRCSECREEFEYLKAEVKANNFTRGLIELGEKVNVPTASEECFEDEKDNMRMEYERMKAEVMNDGSKLDENYRNIIFFKLMTNQISPDVASKFKKLNFLFKLDLRTKLPKIRRELNSLDNLRQEIGNVLETVYGEFGENHHIQTKLKEKTSDGCRRMLEDMKEDYRITRQRIEREEEKEDKKRSEERGRYGQNNDDNQEESRDAAFRVMRQDVRQGRRDGRLNQNYFNQWRQVFYERFRRYPIREDEDTDGESDGGGVDGDDEEEEELIVVNVVNRN